MADYSELLAAENDKKPQSKPVSPVKPTLEKKETATISKEGQNKDARRDVMTSRYKL